MTFIPHHCLLDTIVTKINRSDLDILILLLNEVILFLKSVLEYRTDPGEVISDAVLCFVPFMFCTEAQTAVKTA